MNSIQDAISRAYEIGAPYSSGTITIKLLPGLHAMVRYQTVDYYMPTKYD